jgi:hypothetical protein
MLKKAVFLLLPLLLVFVSVGWFLRAFDYSDSALAGVYSYQTDSIHCTLSLTQDFRYKQTLQFGTASSTTEGIWGRAGESGIVFSADFKLLPGQTRMSEGEVYGYFHRRFNLFMELTLQASPTNYVLHKHIVFSRSN